MIPPTLLLLALTAPARSAPRAATTLREWRHEEIDPKVNTDFTAFTVGQKHLHLSPLGMSYGLLDNTDVGTDYFYYFALTPNLNVKITAIQTEHFDLSLQGAWYRKNLESAPYNVPNGVVELTPVGFTGSWTATQKFSLHAGANWNIVRMVGSMKATDMALAMGNFTGVDVNEDLTRVLLGNTSVYAGGTFTLSQLHLATEYRFNRRDSIIAESNTYVHMTGLVAGGIADTKGGTEIEVGPSVRFEQGMTGKIPTITSLSYQMSLPRLNVRVGVPLLPPAKNRKQLLQTVYGYNQAFEVSWLIGPDLPPSLLKARRQKATTRQSTTIHSDQESDEESNEESE